MSNTVDNFLNRYELKEINRIASESPEKLVELSEKKYRCQLMNIANDIADNKSCKVIMLAGPSGSGKTTSAKLLAKELKLRGRKAVLISLDDFYLSGEDAPIGDDGNRDYETVYALDIDLVRQCVASLINVGESDIPQYCFGTGDRLPETKKVILNKSEIAIIEGLHALNPIFTAGMDPDGLVKIFINPGGIIADGSEDLLSGKELRFMRRLIRDFQFRMAPAETTLSMWQDVVESEKKYIDPFKRDRDYYIRTIHLYEPCVIGVEARELLKKVSLDNEHYHIVEDILRRTEKIVPIDEKYVPSNSLLREFLGKGEYDF